MLSRADLECCIGLLMVEITGLELEAENARRVDSREAHSAEDRAEELRPVLARLRAELEPKAAPESCAKCGRSPIEDRTRGLCASCAVLGEAPQ